MTVPDSLGKQNAREIEQDNGLPPRYFSSSLFLGSMTAIGMGLLAGIAAFGFAAPILSLINNDIGPSPGIFWVSLTYTLAIAVGLTLIGRITNIFGRRYVFVAGGVVGTAGSIVCACAQNINTLIGGMTMLGLAASTQVSYFYIMAELVPMKYRFAGNAIMYTFTVPAGAFGPAIANAFVLNTSSGWRGCFYVLIAINAITLLCFSAFYWPSSFRQKHSGEQKRAYLLQFDYIGTILFTGGLLILLMGLSWGGALYSWNSAHVIATIIVGGVALIGFILWECYAPLPQPLVPMHLLLDRGWVAAVITSGLGASLYYGLAVVWPSMVSVVYASSNPVQDSLIACVVGAGWLAGEITSGFTAIILRRIKLQSIVTFIIAGVLLACVATCTVDSRARACWLVSFGTFFAGWVEGLSLTTTTLCLGDQDKLGTGCGFGGSIRFSLTTILTAVYNTVLTVRLNHTVPAQITRVAGPAGLTSDAISAVITALNAGQPPSSVPGVTGELTAPLTRAYKEANVDAYRTVFYTTIAVSSLGVIATLLLPDTDKLMTTAVATPLARGGANASEKGAFEDSSQDPEI